MRTNRRFYNKATRYLASEMGHREQSQFENGSDLAGNRQLFNRIANDWNTLTMHIENDKVNTPKAWNRLMTRFESEQLIETEMNVPTGKLRLLLVRVAAAILLIATLGALWMGLPWLEQKQMLTLASGHEVSTLFQSLPDGSRVFLANSSTLTFPKRFKASKREVKLNGSALFDIRPNAKSPFIIECNGRMVEVLGTTFQLSTQTGTFELKVETGVVKVFSFDNPADAQLVTAGEQLISMGNTLVKSNFEKVGAPRWVSGTIRFKDAPLGEVVEVLNQQFEQQIVFAHPAMANRKLTATFEGNSLDTITEALCRSLNLKHTIIDRTVVLSELAN